jgi:predicted Zn-dependent protease with MMP-like domain
MLALLVARRTPHDTRESTPGPHAPSAISNHADSFVAEIDVRSDGAACTYARNPAFEVAETPIKVLKLAMGEMAGKRVERFRRRRFETLVARALDGLPPHIVAMLDNVEIVVEDEPTPEQFGQHGGDDALFGLYEGIPLVARDSGYAMTLPDRIIIFRRPFERACRSPAEIAREVRITVLHELGHHFGFDEDRLEELGLG